MRRDQGSRANSHEFPGTAPGPGGGAAVRVGRLAMHIAGTWKSAFMDHAPPTLFSGFSIVSDHHLFGLSVQRRPQDHQVTDNDRAAVPPTGNVGPEPEAASVSEQGLGWTSTYGKGNAEDTITSGLEGAWTSTPTRWSNGTPSTGTITIGGKGPRRTLLAYGVSGVPNNWLGPE